MELPPSGGWPARAHEIVLVFIEFHLFVQEKGSLFQSSLRGVLAPCATRRTQCPLVGGVAWAFVPVSPVPPSSPCPLELSVPRRGGCGVCWGLLDLVEGRGDLGEAKPSWESPDWCTTGWDSDALPPAGCCEVAKRTVLPRILDAAGSTKAEVASRHHPRMCTDQEIMIRN